MNITALFQRLCHAEIRRLLFIISMVIAAVVVFQCFALPNRRTLSVSPVGDKGSIVVMVGNATILNHSKSMKFHVVNAVAKDTYASDLDAEAGYENETEDIITDYDLGSDVEKSLDDFSQTYKDRNSHNEFTFKKGVANGKSFIIGHAISTNKSSTQVKAIETGHGHIEQIEKEETSYNLKDDSKATTGLSSGGIRIKAVIAPVVSPQISTKGEENLDVDSRISDLFFTAHISSVGNVKQTEETQPKNAGLLQTVSVVLNNNSTIGSMSMLKNREIQPMSISQMNAILLQNHVFSLPMRPRWSSVRDRELLLARQKIENAPRVRNSPGLYDSVFQNVSMFKRSYELMERLLKVYIYREGEKPIFHQPRMRGIYASEGWFMKLMEGNRKFIVRDPKKAHLFYLPFSATMLRTALFEPNSRSQKDLEKFLKNYVELIAGKYRFWNRTAGADHFVVACHDWASRLTRNHMKNCIRVLCNANVARGFNISKDTTLPVTYIRSAQDPLRDLGGNPPSERPVLAFFAGSMHGYLRPILLQYWENKEPDMKIFGPMPRDIEGKNIYREHMKSSKYCICARGYEVHTPRVVEAIFYECVPVIISDNYVPPFFEVLNWESFSVFVQEKDIPNLRNILLSIPEEKYLAMQLRVKMVQQHFLWHKPPLKYDLFHMILHSIWYNRVFQIKTK